MYFVYVLYNKDIKKVYIGQTSDLEFRIVLHKSKRFKKSFPSKNPGDRILVYKEKVADRVAALKREKQLKSYRGREFVKKHIPR